MNYLQNFIDEINTLKHSQPEFDNSLQGLLQKCLYLLPIAKNPSFIPSVSDFLRQQLLILQDELDRPLKIAILGQFSSGKSSFLNAILGGDLLPTGITPITSKVCHICYGDFSALQIHYRSGRVDTVRVETFKTLERNQHNSSYLNQDNIAYFTLLHPNPLLKSLNFIDTPGFNSQNADDTETTKAILQNAAAIIWLTLIDNVGKQSEKEILQNYLKTHANKAICILNQKDRLKNTAEITQSLQYAKEAFGGFFKDFLTLSTKEALNALKATDTESSKALLQSSGMEEVFSLFHTLNKSHSTLKQANILNTLLLGLLRLKKGYIESKIAYKQCIAQATAEINKLRETLQQRSSENKAHINTLYTQYRELLHHTTEEIYNSLQKQTITLDLPKSSLFSTKRVLSKEYLSLPKNALMIQLSHENSPFSKKLKSFIQVASRTLSQLSQPIAESIKSYNTSLQQATQRANTTTHKKAVFTPLELQEAVFTPLEPSLFHTALCANLAPLLSLLQNTAITAITLTLEQLEHSLNQPLFNLLSQVAQGEANPTFTPFLPTLENIRDTLAPHFFSEKFANALECIQGRPNLIDKAYSQSLELIAQNLEKNLQIFNEKIDTIQQEIQKFNEVLPLAVSIQNSLE